MEGVTLYAGRNNGSLILKSVFAIWVLLPFAAFVIADRVAARWRGSGRALLKGAMLVLTLGALAIYGVTVVWPPKAQAAFAFVMTPPASVAILSIARAIASFRRGVPRDR